MSTSDTGASLARPPAIPSAMITATRRQSSSASIGTVSPSRSLATKGPVTGVSRLPNTVSSIASPASSPSIRHMAADEAMGGEMKV